MSELASSRTRRQSIYRPDCPLYLFGRGQEKLLLFSIQIYIPRNIFRRINCMSEEFHVGQKRNGKKEVDED